MVGINTICLSCQPIGWWEAQSVYILHVKVNGWPVGCTEHLTDMAVCIIFETKKEERVNP